MKIDTEFEVGEQVCYISGDEIFYSTIRKITIEMNYVTGDFTMVYWLWRWRKIHKWAFYLCSR